MGQVLTQNSERESMEATRLIRNTNFEKLALKYKRYQEFKANSLIRSNRKNTLIRQIMESFEFLCDIGKPNYTTMSPNEFKIAQQEIRKRANAELERLEQSFRMFGFLAFIPRWFLGKKIYYYKFKLDHGYNPGLNYSNGFEICRMIAQTYRINKLPVNFEELVEQIIDNDSKFYGLISRTEYDDFHG